MLVYEKTVDGQRQLWGSTTTYPTDNDVHLTYLNDDRQAVDVALTDSFIDGGNGTIKVLDKPNEGDKTTVNVWMGNKSIIPQGLEEEVGTACDMLTFTVTIKGTKCKGTITAGTTNTVAVTAPSDTEATDLQNLKPIITISPEATVSPASKASQTFVAGTAVPYTVTAEDGTHTKQYNVTITIAQ